MCWLTVSMVFFVMCSHLNLGCAMASPPFDLDSSSAQSFKTGEILVKFKQDIPESVLQELHDRLGSTVVKRFKSISVQQVKLREGLSVNEAIHLYQADPNVQYAEKISSIHLDKK